ncbi:MAG TPA: TIGR02302 family protein [Amaricoccus sp.]|nr:TIGR02302 family protein [Amaricoccus sp.]
MRAERRATGARDPLARVVRRSRAAMALESFVRAFWPLGSVLALAWAALAFGLAEITTRAQMTAALGLVGVILIGLFIRGLRRFRWPGAAEARARIDATLPGRPLAALSDEPALGRDDPAAQGVWAAHLARMRRIAASARPVAADLRLAAHDPWAIRLVALVALLAAAVFARDRGIEAVSAALAPAPGTAVVAGPSFEGWAEPPAYTGRPTLYLPEVAGGAPVAVPEGTEVTIRAYGDPERFAVEETVSGGPPAAIAEAAPGIGLARFSVATSGEVALERAGREIGAWSFTAEPDLAPEIRLAGPVEVAPSGETRLPWEGKDDHGITGAEAEIALDLPRVERRYGLATPPTDRPPLVAELPMPLTGGSQDVSDTLVEDFSKHPFAGLPVTVTLRAEDAKGQAVASAPEAAVLPMRRFYDPMARALVEQRRDLLWSPGNARRVTQVLRAVANHPEEAFDSPRAYLVVRAATRRLAEAEKAGTAAAVQDEVAEALWQAAVQIEDGNLGDARERLAKARERLQQALREGAPDEEVARLMDELRQATRDYMDEMARDAIQNGDMQQAEIPPGQTMTQDQIQELMDRIQELSEQGRKAEAEALLEMLQQMLDNMQMMMGQQGGGPGENGQGQQSMQGLADALREQQGLADESFQQLQRQFQRGRGGQGQSGQPGERDGQGGQAQEGDAGSLAERQEALRRLTEELERGLPGAAGEAAREALREAERNMGEAAEGLRDGDAAGALDRQADAIDSLREGMRQMGEDLRRAEGTGEGEQGQLEGSATAENGRDPLGRPTGGQGGIGTAETMVPEADSAARARALLDEIRRRVGEQMRPKIELDYLQRLLDLF